MRHSPVFRDVLSHPTRETMHATVEIRRSVEQGDDGQARTVLHLPDSPEDLGHFLRLFFPGHSLNIWALEPTIHQLSACIRLGKKYQCDQVVRLSLDYLKKWFTETSDAWFNVGDTIDPPQFQRIHVIGVVNLARLADAPSLLPTALMLCCTLGAEIVDGFTREDGTRETLSPEDLGRVFAAKAKLLRFHLRATHQLFQEEVAPGCARSRVCAGVLSRLLGKVVDDEGLFNDLRWSSDWDYYVDANEVAADCRRELCSRCYEMVTESRAREIRTQLFNDMPSMMGVTVENWAGKVET
ncbi:hypothetical protein BV20DRAFT_1035611 [Pilatotrama ljubarskyi]|nr:hypothetical protein BV20DRAFT_1035611 [Pilatotrama ljubarskyi]